MNVTFHNDRRTSLFSNVRLSLFSNVRFHPNVCVFVQYKASLFGLLRSERALWARDCMFEDIWSFFFHQSNIVQWKKNMVYLSTILSMLSMSLPIKMLAIIPSIGLKSGEKLQFIKSSNQNVCSGVYVSLDSHQFHHSTFAFISNLWSNTHESTTIRPLY